MPEFDPWLALVRGLHVAAMISSAGALLFRAIVTRGAARTQVAIARVSLVAAFGFGVVWLLMVTQDIAGGPDLPATIAALPVVLEKTQFGHLTAAKLGLLLFALAMVRQDRRFLVLAIVSSFAALVLQAFLGHAAAEDAWALPGTESLHLIGAAAWLGGLLPLLLLVSRSPAPAAVAAARRFSPLALGSVVLIAGTGLVQATTLIGSVSALTETAYGQVALAKMVLFAFLLVLAALNRFVFIGSLGDRRPDAARRRLHTSVGVEVALGLAVVLTAGVLASLPPAAEAMAMHQH